MSNISGKYAIVGVAETKVGKRPDATHAFVASRMHQSLPR